MAHELFAHFQAGLGFYLGLDLLRTDYGLVAYQHQGDRFLDCDSLLFFEMFFISLLLQLLRFLFCFSRKAAHELGRDPELLGNILMEAERLFRGGDDLFYFLGAQVFPVPLL